MKKKYIIVLLCAVLLALSGWLIWNKIGSTTKVALVNFQPYQTTSLAKSNTNKFIQYEEVPLEKLDQLKNYDFVMVFGMGVNLSTEQREKFHALAAKKVPVLIYAATTPENDICSLDSVTKEGVLSYLQRGNKYNYANLALYIRQHIDKKIVFATPAKPPIESISNVLYHLDENVSFSTVSEYETYLKKNHFYKEGAPKLAIVGGMNDPFSGNRDNIDSLIISFERSGMNVYPVSSMMQRLDFLLEIKPDAVVYFAHGRLAIGQPDAAIEWLKEKNIPIFSPLTTLQPREEWEKDPMGMFGGFMSQSIVMPELDGAIYPYVINAQEVDKEGLYLFKTIPERLHRFTQIINNFIALRQKNNADKKVAIYYFKGAGQETLTAQGLETVPSLYNVLKRLKTEGYTIENLPATLQDFEKLLMTQGAVLNTYAEGTFDNFMKNGKPALIEKSEYETWIEKSIPKELYKEVTTLYGEAPGNYMSIQKNNKSYLAVARIQLGNIALLPQPMAGLGDDAFAIVHGAKSAPPHTYIAAYLWSQHAFKADAMLHFGTHGSLEFTPQKQVALSNYDWPDCLVGTIPHFYYYTIGNVGESMMAKRRSYASIISYLTPPFMESNTRSQFKTLQESIQQYYKTEENRQPQASLKVKKVAVNMGLHRELRIDSVLTKPYTTEDIVRIENFAEEIANEKMTGQLYTSGIPYETAKIRSSVMAMSADPIAYSLAALDRQKGEITNKQLKNKALFTQRYLNKSKTLVNEVLNGKMVSTDFICKIAGITEKELEEAIIITAPRKRGMMAMRKTNSRMPEYTKEQKENAHAIVEVQHTLNNILNYQTVLQQSPEAEIFSILNALKGGYIAPSSGGDAVSNPLAAPTGRNLYAVNAETTPSETAWGKGKELVNATLEQYKKQYGNYPRKVSYTFWSSEFIESEGTTIAQAFYMLGIEPVRDAFGRISDLRLIESEILGRPRIDIVVQTSGQFRDLAASRLALITRAVEMAASAKNDKYENFVNKNSIETEHRLVEQGISPKESREMSTQRVFGGINGMYGTGIQEMVNSSDKWESEKEIAENYIHNMGAVYSNHKNWGNYQAGLLRAVLHNTDVVIQPRQSNTWGALSLDHVYEFMGGMNLAVHEVTGKDPEAYFADYRNRNNVKIQELKEAIGVESRSTIFNPEYIKEIMKGGASSASQITEVVSNTYGWNVMKPDVVDNEMWNQIYDVYVKDSYNMGIQKFFEAKNPAALQEMTAVMMETARKGMWKASEQQLNDIASLHTHLVKEHGISGSGFSGSNTKLQEFISNKVNTQQAKEYKQQIQSMKTAPSTINKSGMILKKEEMNSSVKGETNSLNGAIIVSIVLIIFVSAIIVLKKKRKNN